MSPFQLFFLVLLIALVIFVGALLVLISGRARERLGATKGKFRSRNQTHSANRATGKNDEPPYHDSHGHNGTVEINEVGISEATSSVGFSKPDNAYAQSSGAGVTQTQPSTMLDSQSAELQPTIQNRPPVALRSRTKLYHYTALVTSVYDGDTLTVDIDLGMNTWAKNQVIRLWKIDTPELRGPERAAGLEVRDFVRDLVLHKYILLRTILDKRGQDKTGKYGRILGEILLEDEDGEILNINNYLLAKGLALPFGIDGSAINVPVPAGTPQRSASPFPSADDTRQQGGIEALPVPKNKDINCPFCGELRIIDLDNQMILACPNCLDTTTELGKVDS